MTHVTGIAVVADSVRRGGTTRRAICACGWHGPQRGTMVMAADDAIRHERDGERVAPKEIRP
jgi:hypothetical protein